MRLKLIITQKNLNDFLVISRKLKHSCQIDEGRSGLLCCSVSNRITPEKRFPKRLWCLKIRKYWVSGTSKVLNVCPNGLQSICECDIVLWAKSTIFLLHLRKGILRQHLGGIEHATSPITQIEIWVVKYIERTHKNNLPSHLLVKAYEERGVQFLLSLVSSCEWLLERRVPGSSAGSLGINTGRWLVERTGEVLQPKRSWPRKQDASYLFVLENYLYPF
jgi:hypothetical protein